MEGLWTDPSCVHLMYAWMVAQISRERDRLAINSTGLPEYLQGGEGNESPTSHCERESIKSY